MSYSNKFMVFLAAAFILLSGAETEQADRFGGTLPLRGDGTLPLKMPAGGTLPLVMTGAAADATETSAPGVVMSMDIEIAPGTGNDAAAPASVCADLFGPIWESASGTGLIIIGDEELMVQEACQNKLSDEVALVAVKSGDEASFSCFVTGLMTLADLSAVSGQMTCSEVVTGTKDHVFRLLSQG